MPFFGTSAPRLPTLFNEDLTPKAAYDAAVSAFVDAL